MKSSPERTELGTRLASGASKGPTHCDGGMLDQHVPQFVFCGKALRQKSIRGNELIFDLQCREVKVAGIEAIGHIIL